MALRFQRSLPKATVGMVAIAALLTVPTAMMGGGPNGGGRLLAGAALVGAAAAGGPMRTLLAAVLATPFIGALYFATGYYSSMTGPETIGFLADALGIFWLAVVIGVAFLQYVGWDRLYGRRS